MKATNLGPSAVACCKFVFNLCMAQLQNQGDRNKKQLHVLSSDWLKID